MMNVFTYFVEPASYTLDLINNIHAKRNIDYVFIKNSSYASSNKYQNNFNALEDYSFLSKLNFIIKTWKKYDFIIINGYDNYVFVFTYLLNYFSAKKKYIAIESDTQLRVPKNIFKKFYKSIYLNAIFKNKYILGLSGGSVTHKKLFKYYGLSDDRLFLLPMVVDNNKFFSQPKNFPKTFTYLYVGRLIPTKNIDILCQIFMQKFLDKDAKLVVVGSCNNLDLYKQKYMHDKIKFLGAIYDDKLINQYHAASVFVFPSTDESWGLVVNEALSSSLPVIAHREVGSVYDLIINKKTGFVIEDWFDLERRMLELYDNQELCKDFSNNAFNIMNDYWNYNLYKKSLDNILKYVFKNNI